MGQHQTPTFQTNAIAQSRREQYLDVTVDVSAILRSWRMSLFSHEWLAADGQIKEARELPASEQLKRQQVEFAMANNEALPKPVLGIGLLENIEIGAGKAEFLTLAALGHRYIPVHIPKSSESDFKAYLCDVP